jgi:sugar lactone lactonase YvrE
VAAGGNVRLTAAAAARQSIAIAPDARKVLGDVPMFAIHMRVKLLAVSAGLALALPFAAGMAQQPAAPADARPAADYNVSKRTAADKALPNPYLMNQAWYTMPKGRYLGGASGIEMDRDGKSIWVFERCGGRDLCLDTHIDPIMHISPEGKVIAAFGRDLVAYPHGLHIDKDGNIWVTDLQSNVDPVARRGRPIPPMKEKVPTAGATVLKFSPAGKLLMTIGTPGVYGNDGTHFSQPSDVITNAAGEIFVVDAHDSTPSNDRLVKFDKTGKFIKQWPLCQPEDAHKMDCGHALAFDSRGRLFVGNRGNNSVDIYDQEGKLLDRWKQFGKPSGLYIDPKDTLYVSDSQSGIGESMAFVKGVHIGSAKTGAVTAFIPDPLGNMSPWSGPGTLTPEGVAVDKDGIIYTSSVNPPGLTKYTINNNFKVAGSPAPAAGQ